MPRNRKKMFRLLAVTAATLAVTAEASAVQLTKANCKTTIHFFTVLFFYLHTCTPDHFQLPLSDPLPF
jgi:hypothetical protein